MLTLKQINALPVGRHLLESNFYVRVRNEISRYYTFMYTRDGHRKEITFGKVSDVPLKVARQKAQQCRLLLSQGIDPKTRREEYQAQLREQERQRRRARVTLREFYDSILDTILDAKQLYGANSKRKFTHLPYTHIMPVLGNRPVAEITTEDRECQKFCVGVFQGGRRMWRPFVFLG